MDRSTLTDEDLVVLCRRQLPYNTDGFTMLVTRFESRVFDTCFRYLGNHADAEEVTQNVFLKIFHALKTFEGRSSFRTWVFRITANECATRYRKIKRRRERQDAYARSVVPEQRPAGLPGHSDEPIAFDGRLGTAWHSLSEKDREILILRYVSELSLVETADTLDIGLSATKMRLYRAEDRLRQAYAGAQDDVTFSSRPNVSPQT